MLCLSDVIKINWQYMKKTFKTLFYLYLPNTTYVLFSVIFWNMQIKVKATQWPIKNIDPKTRARSLQSEDKTKQKHNTCNYKDDQYRLDQKQHETKQQTNKEEPRCSRNVSSLFHKRHSSCYSLSSEETIFWVIKENSIYTKGKSSIVTLSFKKWMFSNSEPVRDDNR